MKPKEKDLFYDGITLNGILFVTSEQWTIWINGIRIDANRIPNWIKIHKVTYDSVSCKILYKGAWQSLSLAPHSKLILRKM
jgi:hypothetical protein